MSFYLISNADNSVIWMGEEPPTLEETQVKCLDELYLCFNAENSRVVTFDTLEDFVQGKYIWTGETMAVDENWTNPQDTSLQVVRLDLFNKVDDYVAETSKKYTRFSNEYIMREAAAREFRSNDYVGEPHVLISKFALEVGISTRQATDLTISQADSLGAAVVAMGNLRMRKYRILRAESIAECNSIYTDILKDGSIIMSQVV